MINQGVRQVIKYEREVSTYHVILYVVTIQVTIANVPESIIVQIFLIRICYSQAVIL